MKTISRLIPFVFILTFCCGKSFSQTKNSQAYFIRSLNYVGSVVPFKLYIDDVLVCKLKNNKYSVHDLSPGAHTFAVQNTGLSSHRKSIPLKINVEENKTVYLTVVNGSSLYLQEVTQASADMLIKKTVQVKDCQTGSKDK
jgi:hypothetical protein